MGKRKRMRVEQTGQFGQIRRKKKKEMRGFSLLSKIYGDRAVGFYRGKKQSRSTHRELRVGTKILKFRQAPRGREFS